MPDQSEVKHLTLDVVADYCGELLSAEAEAEVEMHLAACTSCAEQVRQMWPVASLWEMWTARSHGAIRRRAVLVRALEETAAEESNPAAVDRLRHWRDMLVGVAAGVIDRTRELQQAATGQLGKTLQLGGIWRFNLVPVRGRSSETVTLEMQPGVNISILSVPSGTRDVTVKITPWPGGARELLALLVSLNGNAKPRRAVLEQSAAGREGRAVFRDVPNEDYVLAVEPVQARA